MDAPMTDSLPKQQRRALIDEKRADATALLAAANHETMKQLVRQAERDLREAAGYLDRGMTEIQEPWLLAMVDYQVYLADGRLALVRWAVSEYGPDAMMFSG